LAVVGLVDVLLPLEEAIRSVAKVVSFSITQRISVENILNQQRGDLESTETLSDVLEKITVPNRKDFINEVKMPDGSVHFIIDEEALEKEPPLECEMEKAEVRALLKILKEFKGYTPADLKWARPLIKALDN
jgi:hypothetical protein